MSIENKKYLPRKKTKKEKRAQNCTLFSLPKSD